MVYQIIFAPKKEGGTAAEEEEHLICDFLSTLYLNGQILCDYQLIRGNTYRAVVTAPKACSLKSKFDNEYVAEKRAKVEALFQLRLTVLGENAKSQEFCCCQECEKLIMVTCDGDRDSVFVCVNCGKPVALYELPKLGNEKEYTTLLWWQDDYKAVESLWMNSLSDRFSRRQLCHPDSALNKNGRRLAAEMESRSGRTVYYEMFYGYLDELPAVCPLCKREFDVIHNERFTEYVCDNCRICYAADKREE